MSKINFFLSMVLLESFFCYFCPLNSFKITNEISYMKKIILFVIALCFGVSTFAQPYYGAGKMYVGPSIAGGFLNSQVPKWEEGMFRVSPQASVGAFVGYSFSDLFGIQGEVLYNGSFSDWKSNNIDVPVILTVQFFDHQHFGLGLMYHHPFNTLGNIQGFVDYDVKTTQSSNLYAIAEFSTLTERIFKIGNIVIFTGEITKTRAFFKFGYALLPTKANVSINANYLGIIADHPNKISFSPFFFEFGLRYNFLGMHEDYNYKKSNSKSGRVGKSKGMKKGKNKRKSSSRSRR